MQSPPVRSLLTPLLLAAAMVLLLTTSAWALEYRLAPVADTSIFSDNYSGTAFNNYSDGGGSLWLSTNQGGQVRRTLIRFDLSAIPAGVQVTSAQLVLYQIRARGFGDPTIRVHRLLNTWGEASTNNGGSGSGLAALPGDATWIYRFYPSSSWAQPGGDHSPQASTALSVNSSEGQHIWPSTPQMVADVQGWLASPASNHGWVLIGDEVTDGSAKRMGSRQSTEAVLRPVLIVQAEPPAPTPAPEGDVPLPLWALACLGGGLWALTRRRA